MTSIVLRVGEVELAGTSDPELLRRVARHLLKTTRPTAADPAERAMEIGRTEALKAIVRENQRPRPYGLPTLSVLVNETA